MSTYKERQQARRDRLETAADRSVAKSNAAYRTATSATEHIPMGQPILVGHHSERRHRRDIARSDTAMRKSIELAEHADELARRAAAVGTGGISADNPDAIVELQGQLQDMESSHVTMLGLNKAFKRELKARGLPGHGSVLDTTEDRASRLEALDVAMEARGLPEHERDSLRQMVKRCPYVSAPYDTAGNSANMRRIRKRIAQLEQERAVPASADQRFDDLGLTVEDRPADNRVGLLFDSKPRPEARAVLKRNGWRWAPSVGAWQRQRNDATRYAVERTVEALRGL